jgi:cyclophilin family peptidyl-prolyl cis-trans isomerase/HEAT repeat protein
MKNALLPLCLFLWSCGSPADPSASAPANNKWSDARLTPVLEAQDHRDTQRLLALLTDTSSVVREAAAMAFASVQDSAANQALLVALRDEQPSVRQAAARALSFTADTTVAKMLAEQALKETSAEVANSIYASSFRALVRAKPAQDPQLLFAAFTKSTGYQRACIADVLRRLPKELIAQHEARYVELLQREREPYVKVLLIAGLRNFSDQRAAKAAAELVRDPDPMIRVSALRAHAAINGTDAAPDLLKAVQDSSPAVRSTAVQLLQGMDALDGEACRKAGQETTDVMTKIPLYGLALKFGGANTRNAAASQLKSLRDRDAGPYVRAALIDARARTMSTDTLIAWMQRPWPAVERQAAFTSAVEHVRTTMMRTRYASRNTRYAQLVQVLRAAFATGDAGLIAAAADELLEEDADVIAMVLDPAAVQQANAALHPIRDLEARQMLEQAVAKRDGLTAPPHQGPVFNHPIDRARLATLQEGKQYRITTAKGEIVIAIEPNAAPGTCVAFDSLVTSGFYNGKYFHRVVPNFVAQGGCPRGDGYGAMDWTLRTESGFAGFVAGAVGIASAGRDTESCQFFITLAPAPHLDGRYTRFAHVVSGMEVAQRLAVGDEISRVGPVQ